MIRNSFIFLLLLFALAGGGGSASVAAQSPDKILKKATKALGGEARLRSVKSWQAKGTITRVSDGAQGAFQSRAMQPNFYNNIFDLNGAETETGFNGKSGWQRESKNNLQTLTGTRIRDFQAEAGYRNNRWLNYKTEKSKIAAGGQASLDGKTANVVILTTAKNARIKIYFDAATGLPIREEFPAGEQVKILDYDDYRMVGDINEPFSITESTGAEKYVVKLDQIVHNPSIAKSVFDFPRLSSEPLPDIAALLKQVGANEDRVDQILENYTYTETRFKRETGSDGKVREREIEKNQVSFYKGHQIRRLIAKDGKPLSAEEAEKEDRKAANYIEDIDEKLAKQTSREMAGHSAQEPASGSGARISIGEVLRASRLINPRRERFRDRDVIVFDFEPNPDFDYSNTKSLLKFFGRTAGAIWIDEKDKQVARVEASLADNFKVAGGMLANVKKGTSFVLEQNRVNDEIWLPTSVDVNVSVKVFLVKNINLNQNARFSDYQKFKSEVKDAKIDETKIDETKRP